MGTAYISRSSLLLIMVVILLKPEFSHATITRHFKFDVKMKSFTRLCHKKSIVTVNGRFPGPKIVTREGDRVVVKVVNHVKNNVTIHWHGVRQLRTGWADGPAYITQCPIQTGQSYVYKFTIIGQRGTLWWHAHVSWMRATVYGPIIILPKIGVPYPFPKPNKEVPIIFGEWFSADIEAVIAQALQSGGGPNVSDAYTINGFPGPLYNCSKDTYNLEVSPGKTYLLRLINAALNDELFFTVANHSLTVVEADAVYVKPFTVDTLVISPGQTYNVLLDANPGFSSTFMMAASAYNIVRGSFDTTTTAALLSYQMSNTLRGVKNEVPVQVPALPLANASDTVARFVSRIRRLDGGGMPRTVDRRYLFTVGLGTSPCVRGRGTCQGPNGSAFAASVNNASFVLPASAMLEAHYRGRERGVYTADLPVSPPFPWDYTGATAPPGGAAVVRGTRVVAVPYNASVEMVLQGTSTEGAESHPLHLHGHNVFVVGRGSGNYDAAADPPGFNLVDPAERNTVGVPAGGWVAVRFRADNPGVWFMHCHLEVHLSWGLSMAWVVNDGDLPNQKLPPAPLDLPKC